MFLVTFFVITYRLRRRILRFYTGCLYHLTFSVNAKCDCHENVNRRRRSNANRPSGLINWSVIVRSDELNEFAAVVRVVRTGRSSKTMEFCGKRFFSKPYTSIDKNRVVPSVPKRKTNVSSFLNAVRFSDRCTAVFSVGSDSETIELDRRMRKPR